MADANFSAQVVLCCAHCGVQFPKPKKPSEAKRRKYCGRECSLEAIHNGLKIPLAERFWVHVAKAGPDDCWEWQRRKDRRGYGLIGGDKRETLQAHRVAYEFEVAPIPDGLVIRHKCDNPACCNPAHLETGTQADNIMDMMKRNRCAAVKVPNETVLQVHADFIAGMSCQEIAEKYGISRYTAKSLVRRGRAGLIGPVPAEIRKANGVRNQLRTRFNNGFIGPEGKRAAELVFGGDKG